MIASHIFKNSLLTESPSMEFRIFILCLIKLTSSVFQNDAAAVAAVAAVAEQNVNIIYIIYILHIYLILI